jgi:serine/threonine-protein kinase
MTEEEKRQIKESTAGSAAASNPAVREEEEDVVIRKPSRTGKHTREEDLFDEEDDYDEEERENSMDRIARILAVLAVVIIIAIIALIVGGRNGLLPIGGGGQNASAEASDEMVVMPNVVGIDVAAARSALVKQGLIPELTYEESDKYTVGIVMDSSVKEGTEIPVGTTVVLTVCGNTGTMVPDVTGLLREEAVDMLTEAGFNVNIMEVSSEDIEAGIVVGQDPAGETQAEEGTYVTVQVSGGPDLSGKTEMPTLIGMTEQEARNTLNAFGLKAGNVRTIIDTDSDNRGLVISQDVEPGSMIEEGTAVNFDIAGQQTYSYSADISAPTHSEDPDYKSGTSVHITIVTEDDQKLLDTTTSAFPYRMGCTGITSEYGTLTMTYEVTITETYEEEVEEETEEEETTDTGSTEEDAASEEESEGGRKTVTRVIERTEERTITRELTFTPEN